MVEEHVLTVADDAALGCAVGRCSCGWSRRAGPETLALEGRSRHDALRRAHAAHALAAFPVAPQRLSAPASPPPRGLRPPA